MPPGTPSGQKNANKAETLAPFFEQALERKTYLREPSDDEIPELHAYGRDIVERKGVKNQARGGSFSRDDATT